MATLIAIKAARSGQHGALRQAVNSRQGCIGSVEFKLGIDKPQLGGPN